MKVYQCIHQYEPHIQYFEDKYTNIISELSFSDLRNLLIEDGYANTYILKPAIERKSDEVFYTIWDYETLQFKWAHEHGLITRNLDEIKLAQIEEFKPDVFYNHTPNYDNDFVLKIGGGKKIIKACWDAIIDKYPSNHSYYDVRFSLFEPYIKYWNQHGYNACLLSPAFAPSWEKLEVTHKDIDILFYGQYLVHYFSGRNNLLKELMLWSRSQGLTFNLHIQYSYKRKSLINKKGFRKITRWIPYIPKIVTRNSLSPIYGQKLYDTIARSKVVLNSFGNFNGLYKDNMRNYEAIGCGAFLIGEDGIYPEHFKQNQDFYAFRTVPELFDKIHQVLTLPDQGFSLAQKTREKLRLIYTKNYQWQSFISAINSL